MLNEYFCKSMELVTTFNTTLNDFIGNLQKCFPNDTDNLKLIEVLTDTRPLQKFMKCIEKDLDKISKKDELLFNKPLICIDNFNLSEVWLKTNNTKNKEAIWKFLQTLSLIGTTIRSKSTNLEEFFDQIQNDDNFLDNENGNILQKQMMDILEKLMNSSEENEENETTVGDDDESDEEFTKIFDEGISNTDKKFGNSEEEYKKMFENSKIGNLAMEIANDIDMSAFDIGSSSEMENPNISSIMEKLTKGNGLKNLIKDVADKLKNKMASGAVNQEELVGEVHEMMEKMKKDKRFKKMFKSKNVQGIFKEMMKQRGADQFGGDDDDDFGELEQMFNKQEFKDLANKMPRSAVSKRGGQRRSNVRDRLKKKLEEKKNLEM